MEPVWRWREFLTPKTFTYLYMGLSREEATTAAVKAGEWSASRVYEVSLDGGATWYSAPSDMPVIDVDGNHMPEELRRSGKPSDAAKREQQSLLDQAAKANAVQIKKDGAAWDARVSPSPAAVRTRRR